jgi:FdhE protein
MPETWRRRIQRAQELSGADHPTRSLIAFYITVLEAQADLHNALQTRRNWTPSGALERDLPFFHDALPSTIRAMSRAASDQLAAEAGRLLDGGIDRVDEMLAAYWRAPSDREFFPKAMIQPYAEWLATHDVPVAGRPARQGSNRCPFCGGPPQLSVFHGGDATLQGGSRALQCATCQTRWPFRRILCAYCGEENERKLEYVESPAFDHVRVEACDTCKHYLKGIDLTRLGLAVPIVDEVAAAPLDAWASEHGYVKIELNLVGL